MTIKFSLICQIRDFGSGQILQPRQFYLSPGLVKIAPCWLVRRDSFVAKVPGLVSADGTTNVYYRNRRAVSLHSTKTAYRLTNFRGILISEFKYLYLYLNKYLILLLK